MMKNKKMLLIKASSDVCSEEISLVESYAKMLNLEVHPYTVRSIKELEKRLNVGHGYDYLYLCSHGSELGFDIGIEKLSYAYFANMVCESRCLNKECIFLLACCQSGLNQVAWDMFYYCDQVQYVCGPSTSLKPIDIATAFHVFLYNLSKGDDATYAIKSASDATRHEFAFFSRLKEEGTMGYHARKRQLEKEDGERQEEQSKNSQIISNSLEKPPTGDRISVH